MTATVVDIHSRRQQTLGALAKANVERLGAAAVRRDLREHRVSFDDAIFDARCSSLTVEKLLRSVPGVGRRAIPAVLDDAGIITHAGFGDPSKRVASLTDRQRLALVDAVRPYLRRPRRGAVA